MRIGLRNPAYLTGWRRMAFEAVPPKEKGGVTNENHY